MSIASRQVPINLLAPGVRLLRDEIDAAIGKVLESGYFLMGPETAAFEKAFASYHGTGLETVGVGTGTDALVIALRALGVEPGDDVLVTANAGVPPVAAVVAAGGRPVFCDVDPTTHDLDPAEIDRKVTPNTKVVLVVHLFGRAAEMGVILERAKAHGIKVLEDCAQAHGARLRGQMVGTFGDAAAFSFFPTKNLGALGDGGAILTRNQDLAARARQLRMYGWSSRYISAEHSTVSRLDELQAAVLNVKLEHLDGANARRRRLARLYETLLADLDWLETPLEPEPTEDNDHVFHLYVVKVPQHRHALRTFLAERGVGTDIHYPLPSHLQTPYKQFGGGEGSLPVSERLYQEVLSLPMYPELSSSDVEYVAEQIRAFGETT